MQTLKRNGLKEYFTFTARERRAVALLAVAAVLFSLLPVLYPQLVAEPEAPLGEDLPLPPVPVHSQQAAEWQGRNDGSAYMAPAQPRTIPFWEQGERFVFDPNTATEADWRRMGVRDKTIQAILNYRSKGGMFRKPEDLARIYTLHPKMYEALRPYIRISAPKTIVPANAKNSDAVPYRSPQQTALHININRAGLEEWMQLRGIGAGYAKRILNFREKLGGFLTVEQVAETFGLPDTTFEKIKPFLVADTQSLRRININLATEQELKAHPYIDWRTAKNIIAFREQHGNFPAVETLLKIGSIDEALFQRIAPYLTVK